MFANGDNNFGTEVYMNKYSDDDILKKIGDLESWQYTNGKLTKMFVFDDFNTAFQFMTKIAQYAEKINHHPEWCNVFKKVNVSLITHDVNGITELDFNMAEKNG